MTDGFIERTLAEGLQEDFERLDEGLATTDRGSNTGDEQLTENGLLQAYAAVRSIVEALGIMTSLDQLDARAYYELSLSGKDWTEENIEDARLRILGEERLRIHKILQVLNPLRQENE